MPDWVSEKLVIQKHQYAETKRKKIKKMLFFLFKGPRKEEA